jgi:hypothetical protein
MVQVADQIAQIYANPNYTDDQKKLMVDRLLAGQPVTEYKRQTEAPDMPEPVVSEVAPAPPRPEWVPDYHKRFSPTFISFSANNTFPLVGGKKEAQIRELLVGDFTKLAALMPRWKNHLLGDENLNPFIMDENDQFNPVRLISLLVTRAMEEWDFQRNCPTGFALSFYQTLKEFLGNPDEIEINDFLNSRPEELIDLVIGIYRANVGFFTKVSARFGIIGDIKTVFSTLFSGLKKILKESGERLSSLSLDNGQQEVKTNPTLPVPAPSGKASGGGMIPSSFRSAKRQKGS